MTAALPCGAQTNGSNSPYSRYGYGLLSDGGNAFNKGMGGTAYGMRKGNELNTKNPASYSAIDSLTFLFDVGLTMQSAVIKQGGNKMNLQNTAIDYISAGFRLRSRLGLSLGLRPYSTIGYEISHTDPVETDVPTEITKTTKFSGDGGLHDVYIGMGWEPEKGFSVGFNMAYLWGTMDHYTLTSVNDGYASSRRYLYKADIRTYKVDFGVQQTLNLAKRHDLTIGLTYGLGHDVDRKALYCNQTITSSTITSSDTLVARNAFSLPHTLGFGLAWTYNNSLRVGADYTFEQWKGTKSPEYNALTNTYDCRYDGFDNRHKVNIGVDYHPKPNGVHWRDHVRYKAGFGFSTPYTRINGQKGPNSLQASLGVGIPITNLYNNRSLLNISVQYERINPRVAGMIKEEYFRLCLGLSFNERWFYKWKAE